MGGPGHGADVIIAGNTHPPLSRDGARSLVVNPGTLLREAKDAMEPSMPGDRASGRFLRVSQW